MRYYIPLAQKLQAFTTFGVKILKNIGFGKMVLQNCILWFLEMITVDIRCRLC